MRTADFHVKCALYLSYFNRKFVILHNGPCVCSQGVCLQTAVHETPLGCERFWNDSDPYWDSKPQSRFRSLGHCLGTKRFVW